MPVKPCAAHLHRTGHRAASDRPARFFRRAASHSSCGGTAVEQAARPAGQYQAHRAESVHTRFRRRGCAYRRVTGQSRQGARQFERFRRCFAARCAHLVGVAVQARADRQRTEDRFAAYQCGALRHAAFQFLRPDREVLEAFARTVEAAREVFGVEYPHRERQCQFRRSSAEYEVCGRSFRAAYSFHCDIAVGYRDLRDTAVTGAHRRVAVAGERTHQAVFQSRSRSTISTCRR